MGSSIPERIAAYPTWHYEFELQGHRTPIFDPSHRNRHEQRRAYLFRPILEHYGGSLAGRRVLDLGSNAGWWALSALDHGADFVLGIDGRDDNIEQANFVFEATGVDPERYAFTTGNIFEFDYSAHGSFDVVLCLGLMMHISKPVSMMEIIDASGADVISIDTSISRAPGSYLELGRQSSAALATHAVEYELRTLPTKLAMQRLAAQFDYSLAVLKPEFSSWEGCQDYRTGFRRGFHCVRGEGAASTSAAVEPLGRTSLIRDGFAWMFGGARSRIGR
jgi:SAM-dependent methyltransferase